MNFTQRLTEAILFSDVPQNIFQFTDWINFVDELDKKFTDYLVIKCMPTKSHLVITCYYKVIPCFLKVKLDICFSVVSRSCTGHLFNYSATLVMKTTFKRII